MQPLEYLLLFAVIILGLAVTDLALSLHRLIAARGRVKWDWLAPLAALVAFLKIVTEWWAWHAYEGPARSMTFEMFVAVLVSCVLLFLLSASALPDEIGPEGVDLAEYYASARRRYWILFASYSTLINLIGIWTVVQAGGAWRLPISDVLFILADLAVAISLVVMRNRWWHTACLVGYAGLYLWQSWGRALS